MYFMPKTFIETEDMFKMTLIYIKETFLLYAQPTRNYVRNLHFDLVDRGKYKDYPWGNLCFRTLLKTCSICWKKTTINEIWWFISCFANLVLWMLYDNWHFDSTTCSYLHTAYIKLADIRSIDLKSLSIEDNGNFELFYYLFFPISPSFYVIFIVLNVFNMKNFQC